jgi:hypothetical protein
MTRKWNGGRPGGDGAAPGPTTEQGKRWTVGGGLFRTAFFLASFWSLYGNASTVPTFLAVALRHLLASLCPPSPRRLASPPPVILSVCKSPFRDQAHSAVQAGCPRQDGIPRLPVHFPEDPSGWLGRLGTSLSEQVLKSWKTNHFCRTEESY